MYCDEKMTRHGIHVYRSWRQNVTADDKMRRRTTIRVIRVCTYRRP